MSNTYRTELVFKGDVKFNKGEQDIYRDMMKQRFGIEVFDMTAEGNDIVFFNRGGALGKKHLNVFKTLKEKEDDIIRVYIEDDVDDYKRSFKM